jgi:hypothetical protein
VSRLTATAPPGGRRWTSNPGWPRGPPPVGASRRDLPTGCARRSPERSPGDGGSNPPTSKKAHVSCVSLVGGGARCSYRARIILAQRIASTARMPLGCGRTQSSRFWLRCPPAARSCGGRSRPASDASRGRLPSPGCVRRRIHVFSLGDVQVAGPSRSRLCAWFCLLSSSRCVPSRALCKSSMSRT